MDDCSFSLLFGRLGRMGPGDCGPEWMQEELIFSLAPKADQEWFQERRHIFRLLFSGSEYCVYTVDIRKLTKAMSG